MLRRSHPPERGNRVLTARSVMRKDVVTVRHDTPVKDAVALLRHHRISGLPVVDAEGRLVGIVTEKDVMRLLYEEAGSLPTVGDLMTPNVRAFHPDDPLGEVCDCLMANHFRRVPIVEYGKLVGLISRADLMDTILELVTERG